MALLKKRYENHYGIDLQSNDLTRPDTFASDITNAQYRKDGNIEKRVGFEQFAASQGGYGFFEYIHYDPTTGAETIDWITIDSKLWKKKDATITVTYAGVSTAVVLSLFYDTATAQYRCQIQEGAIQVLDFALGLGFDEASPVTLADLKTAIDAIINFSSVIVGDTSTPAAMLKTNVNFDLDVEDCVLEAKYWEEIEGVSTTPFLDFYNSRNSSDFENATFVALFNLLYIGTAQNYLMKYDGHAVYRAGLPSAAGVLAPISSQSPGGTVTGTFYFILRYVFDDAQGNFVEGNFTLPVSNTYVGTEVVSFNLPNIPASDGFFARGAIVNGAQSGTNTITVDDGTGGNHTVKAGDKVFFYDSSLFGPEYTTRNVLSVTTTSITIDGTAVDVTDNIVISSNLRKQVLFNTDGSTTYTLVREIPNDPFDTGNDDNQFVTNPGTNAQDLIAGETFLSDYDVDHSPPPKGRYITSWNNQLMSAGDPINPNILSWSDILFPEYFPQDDRLTTQLNMENRNGDKISGIAANAGGFYCFKDLSHAWISGDLVNTQLRIDWRSYELGCASHHSITEIEGKIFWWSYKGPFMSIGGSYPEPVARSKNGLGRLEPIIEQYGVADSQKLQFKRIQSLNDRIKQMWVCFIPAEEVLGGDVLANDNSRIFVYQYRRDSWLEWDNLNLAGGAIVSGDEVVFIERKFSSFSSGARRVLLRFHNNKTVYDYEDLNEPVSMTYGANWEALAEPSILKKFTEVRVFILDDTATSDATLTVQQEVNYIRDQVVSEFDITSISVGYGGSPWSLFPWGDYQEPTLRHALLRDRIRSMRLLFKNEEDQTNIVITGWELECEAPFGKEFKA